MFFGLEYRQIFFTKGTSRQKAHAYKAWALVNGLLGGNLSSDKHRMVPPFYLLFMKIFSFFISLLFCFLAYSCGNGNRSESNENSPEWWGGYKPDLNQATFLNNLGKNYEQVVDSLKKLGYKLFSVEDKDEFLFGPNNRSIHLTNDTTNHSYFIDCNSKTKKYMNSVFFIPY